MSKRQDQCQINYPNLLHNIYTQLQTQVANASSESDLNPFIYSLFSLKYLKFLISKELQEQYQGACKLRPNQENSIACKQFGFLHVLHTKINLMKQIPADAILRHIMEMLSADDLKIISTVSKRMYNATRTCSGTYSVNNYQISIHQFIKPNVWSLQQIDHKNKCIVIQSNTPLDDEDSTNETYTIRELPPKPYDRIKIWKIETWIDSDYSHDVVQILNNKQKYIKSLDITLNNEIHENGINILSQTILPNLMILHTKQQINCKNWINLKYIDLYKTSRNDVISMMLLLPDSVFILSLSSMTTNSMDQQIQRISIPDTIKWLQIRNNYDDATSYDLSKCNELIGCRLFGELIQTITWPHNSVAPYVRILESDNMRREVVDLLTAQKQPIALLSFERPQRLFMVNNIAQISKFNAIKIKLIDIIRNPLDYLDDDYRCYILDGGDECRELFENILQISIQQKTDTIKEKSEIDKIVKLNACKWIPWMFLQPSSD